MPVNVDFLGFPHTLGCVNSHDVFRLALPPRSLVSSLHAGSSFRIHSSQTKTRESSSE